MSDLLEQTPWLKLPVQCPHCGNHGAPDGEWEANSWTPFKLIEEVVRAWPFDAAQREGKLVLTANVLDEQVDWGETDRRIECMQCFESFPIPDSAQVVFE